MISFDDVSYCIYDRKVFCNISLTILSASITYLEGLNGSGKTSLLRLIAGIQRPTSGKIILSSSKLNYIGHNLGIKTDLSVYENIKFWADLYNTPNAVDIAIEYFNLNNVLYQKCYTLSAGNCKKIALTRLICCPADIWLLDEIFVNLDDNTTQLIQNLITAKANSGGVVIIASHAKPNIKPFQVINMKDYLRI
ncbi:MAG: heme ABC exporter ATP-binding protein CcmA [Rickettsiaceae bacterium]